jgi:uncharacterized membrane protein
MAEGAPRPFSGPLLSFGMRFYGAAAIALGMIGFVWADFAANWQRVAETTPYHDPLAYTAAAVELLGGAALFWPAKARVGAAVLTIVYSVFALIWLVSALTVAPVWDSWGNVFEELSIVIAGAAIFAALSPPDSSWSSKSGWLTRGYGVCPISFGLTHFLFLTQAAPWVPKWMPFGGVFWMAATGAFFMLAAFSILTGILACLASRLLAIMIVGFELLVWVPRVLNDPHDHFNWSGNGICIALAGGAWAVADLIGRRSGAGS